MKIVVAQGSPRKGNTYKATEFFKERMQKQGEIEFVDFILPKDMPEFCWIKAMGTVPIAFIILF